MINVLMDDSKKLSNTQSNHSLSWVLPARQQCDVELLLNGGFHPLTGFLGETDYTRVLSEMRLSTGPLWPIPISLDVPTKFSVPVKLGTNSIA